MFEAVGSLTGGNLCAARISCPLTCWPHFDFMVRLQHRHAFLHSDAEAILSSITEGMAEVVAGAINYHKMALFPFQWNALGLYEPA